MPLYNDRVQTPVSFDRVNLEQYKQHATREGLTFSEWINKLCARACKPDARVIKNRQHGRGE